MSRFLSFSLLLFVLFRTLTANPSPVPLPQPQADISHPRNIIYVQSLWTTPPNVTTNGTHISLLPLIQNPTRVTHVILAALALDKHDPAAITLNGLPPTSPEYDWLWSETATLQSNGVSVLLMLGGAGSVAFNLLEQDFDDYYPPLLSTLQTTGVDGVDLDIEEPTPTSVSLDAVLQLMNTLASDMGDDFVITMAPVASDFIAGHGLEGAAWNYTALDSAATSASKPGGKLVDWFNVQFYDGYGDPGTTADYDMMIANGWAPARMGLGLATYSDLSGYYDLETYAAVIAALRDKYPDFGGVDGWEYGVAGRDETPSVPPWEWVQSVSDAVFGAAGR